MAQRAKQPAKKNLSPWQRYAKTLRHSRLVKFALLWLVSFLILESFLFTSVLRSYNYLEIFPKDLALASLMHICASLLVALAIYFIKWPRSFATKLFSAALFSLFLVNYDARLQSVIGLFRAVLPILPQPDTDIPLISLLFLALLLGIAIAAGIGLGKLQRRYQLDSTNVALGVFIIVGVMFLGRAPGMLEILPQMVRQSHVQAAALPGPKQPSSGTKPDIYYVVLDRYASDATLSSQFSYNNSFTDFLENNNFTVNKNAYSNYPYTTMSISSTLNAQYTRDAVAPFKDSTVQDRALFHNLAYQSSVIKALKASGYQYYEIGSSYGVSDRAPLADVIHTADSVITVLNRSFAVHSIAATQFQQSMFYQFFKVNLPGWPLKLHEQDAVAQARNQLNALDGLATSQTTGGRFIFAHILVPHDPFSFNADGSLSTTPGTDSVGKPIKDKYVGQVQFISGQMQEIINNINRSSKGQAVIILNADEGPYPQTMNDTFREPIASSPDTVEAASQGSMKSWPDDWLKMKFGILQAVHIPEATSADLSHLSSVNIFRIVLNKYLGYNLDYLPDCHYALSRGAVYEFDYYDITAELLGSENPACKAYQSLSSTN